MRIPLHPLLALWLIGSFCIVPAHADVVGLVVDATDAVPIAGARLSVDVDGDAEPDAEAVSNALGMYRLTTPDDWLDDTIELRVVAAGYAPATADVLLNDERVRQDFVLDPVANNATVDIELDVHCVISNSTLPDTEVMVMYWEDAALDGPPDAVDTQRTGPLGRLNLTRQPAGFYRFSFARPGWLAVAWPEGMPIEVREDQSGIVGLEPEDTAVRVHVQTPDDLETGLEGRPRDLADVFVEVIGLDLTTEEDSMPPRMLRTGANGRVEFADMPPVPYRVRVKKPGYLPAETIIRPDAGGGLPDAVVNLRLDRRTRIHLRLNDDLNLPETLARVRVHLEGLEGTPTAGIARTTGVNPRPQIVDTHVEAIFEGLLPGQYRLRLAHQSVASRRPPVENLTLGEALTLFFNFAPLVQTVEVAQAETAQVVFDLKVPPATVHGTLFEEGMIQAPAAFMPLPQRPLVPVANQQIEFVPDAQLQAAGVMPITAMTDADGRYRLTLPPGNYGIRVPRQGVWAWRIQLGFEREGAMTALSEQAWPHARWPFDRIGPFNDGSVSGPLSISNAETYHINPIMRRSVIDLVNGFNANFRAFDLNYLPRGSFQFSDGSRLAATPSVRQARLRPTLRINGVEQPTTQCGGDEFALTSCRVELPPGDYRVEVEHPDLAYLNQFPGSGEAHYTVAFAAPAMPGDPPAVLPPDDSVRHSRVRLTWQVPEGGERVEVPTAPVRIDRSVFNPDTQEYGTANQNLSWIFVDDLLPGATTSHLDFGVGFDPPAERGSVHVPCPDGVRWHRARHTGAIIDVRCGGPLANASAEQAPPTLAGLDVDVHMTARNFPDRIVERVPVTLPGEVVVTHGQAARISQAFEPEEVRPPAGWNGTCAAAVTTIEPLRGRVNCVLHRATALTGQVVRADTGAPVSVPGLRFVDRTGQPIEVRWQYAQGTDAEGRFDATSISPLSEAWVEVIEPGFLPWRQAVQFSAAAPDLQNLRVELTPLPAPMLSGTIDRHGTFLPGVLKSGDSRGFNADNAKASLTATASVTGEAQAVMSQLVRPGATEATPYMQADRITEVYVIDPRIFEAGLAGPSMPLDFPDAPTLRDARTLLRQLGGRRGDDSLNMRYWRANATENGWAVPIELWTLPAGPVALRALAITEQGAVGWTRLTAPDGRQPLRGAQLPRWTAEMLNAVGSLANADVGLQVADLFPAGPLRIGEDFEGGIAVDQNGYLDYRYWIGVTFQEGARAPSKGLIGLAGGRVGLTATGRVEFASSGERGEITVSGTGGLGANDLASTGAVTPGLARRGPINLVTFLPPQLDVAASLDIAQRIGAEGDPDRYMLRRRVAGSVRAGLRVNLEPVFVFIPAIGPALARLKGLGLECTLRFTIALGGSFVSSMRTGYEPVGQDTEDRPRVAGFLGPDDGARQPPDSFLFGSDVALEFRTPGRLIQASGGIQLGPPEGRPMGPEAQGLEVQFATDSDAPYVRRVRGAVSAIARVGFNIAGRSLSRRFQFDLLGIDWQSGTDAFMSLTPAREVTEVVTPATAPAPVWIGADGVLVDRYYPASDRASTADGGLLYVQTDPRTGRMQVRFASGAEAEDTQLVIDAEGIIDVALVDLPEGQKLAAWISFAGADLGDPFAETQIGYARFDGATWSDPELLAETGGYALELRGAASGDAAMFTWLVAPDALATERDWVAARWDGAAFTEPEILEARSPITQTGLAGLPDSRYALARLHADGELTRLLVADENETEALADDATGFALAAGADGTRWLVYDTRAGALMMQHDDAAPVEVIAGAGASDLAALQVEIDDAPAVLTAWYAAGEKQVRYAFIDANGAVLDGPHTLDEDATGARFALALLPTDADDAGELRLVHAVGDRQRLVSYVLPYEGEPARPEPPMMLDGGMADGGVADGGMADDEGVDQGIADRGGDAQSPADGGPPTVGGGDDGGCTVGTQTGRGLPWFGLLLFGLRRRTFRRSAATRSS